MVKLKKKKRCKCFCVSWVCAWSGIAWLLLFICQEVSNSLGPNELQHARLPCPSLSPWVCSNSSPLSQGCHPTIVSFVAPFSSCSVFPGIRVFSSESALRIRWRKDWSFSINISPSNEYSGLISFRIDWFDLLDAQGTLKSFLQHHNSNHQLLGTQPSLWSNSHIHTWLLEKPGLWLYRPLSVQWCLCFLILSRFFIAFLPRSKHLLISWLQSLSTVILEPPKICHCFYFFPVCHEVTGPDAMILVFWMLSFKPAFSLSPLTVIKRLFSSSSLSAIKVVLFAYLR